MSNKPSFIERARIALQVFQNGYPRASGRKAANKFPLIWPDFRLGQAQWRMVDVQSYIDEGFDINTLVYSCIMYKARAKASAPLRAYSGDIDHPEPLPVKHPLSKLVARPNASMSWIEYQMLQDVYFNVAGESFGWLIRPSANKLPTAFYPLNPTRTFIVPRPDRRTGDGAPILGYLYIPEGTSYADGIPILPQDMIHIKLPNPGDPLDGWGYGFSPLAPAARSGDVDNMVTKFLNVFFERGAIPPALLKFDVPLDDATVSEVKERWKEQYGGYENMAGEIGVLDRNGSFEKVGYNFDEMGFETLDERNESRICGPFGVPPQLVNARLGLKHSTYNNWEEARKAFWEDTMLAEIGLHEVEYQYYLQSDDGGFVAYDLSKVPALRKDTPSLITAWTQLVDRGVPKNIAAEVVGLDLPELPDGQVIYMPISMVPMGATNDQSQASNQGAAEAEADTRKALTPPLNKAGFTPEQKAAHWKAVDRIAQSWEGKFGQAAEDCFEHDKREMLAMLNASKSKALENKATVDWQDYLLTVKDYLEAAGAENWRKTFAPMIRGVMTDQGKRWAADLGIAFDVQNPFARDWLNKYTLKFAQPINDTTRDTIAKMVAQAEAEGWSIPTMQDHLGAVFEQWMDGDLSADDFQWFEDRMPPYRREAIARTETIRASNAGSVELFDEWGVKKHEWVSTKDGRTRTPDNGDEFDHLGADGEVVEMGQPFTKTGEDMMYPGDPNGSLANFINCRCTTVPVIGD